MQIKVLRPGLQTTIQDLGRSGWMHMGFSHCGVMDEMAAKIANALVLQPANAPLLEFAMTGPDLVFDSDCQIAITGANCHYELNGTAVSQYQTLSIKGGEQLTFKGMTAGFRGYIAFRQPLIVTDYLGSAATHVLAGIGGNNGRALCTGDILSLTSNSDVQEQQLSVAQRPQFIGKYLIRITEAPETELFAQTDRDQLSTTAFQTSNDLNRMGIRLSGEYNLAQQIPEMSSRGLLPGAIQLPPGEAPIIAAQDAQTTGGYPRIGQIIRADLPVIGQLRPGDSLQFQWTDLSSANQIYDLQQSQLEQLIA